ncbi:MAG: M42 family metallopeptidase [Verrucomicrobiales bacterium]|nr:M42 family metallopeptidase [Verrucomicrobiales bacterium]
MIDYTFLRELINIDSPSGFTKNACDYVFKRLGDVGCQPKRSNKGAVSCSFSDAPRLALAAHVDTLGAIVSGISADGTIRFSLLGGLSLTGSEGEYVRIHTLDDVVYTGTILVDNPSTHANREKDAIKRGIHNMHIRLDEEVYNRYDVNRLGIEIGDFICLNPRYEELPNGYIKSRFLDNKAGCLVLFEIARYLSSNPAPVELFFSNYEEVGHGGTCGYSESIEELLVIDMGVLGNSCMGVETSCSICVKDSTGPYDFEMRKKLVKIARQKGIDHVQDVYPFYGSDGSAALSAGNDFRVGLIGPGVAASHSTERTHKRAIDATIQLCRAYIKDFT